MTASLNNQQSANQKLDDMLRRVQLIDAAGSAAQLALLTKIDLKLGDQIAGGIGGKLSRFAQWSRLGHVFQYMILFTTLHNAAMLSGSLITTMTDLTGQVLYALGIKDEDENAIDINSILGAQVNDFIVSVIGQEAWTGIKTSWNRANRIISTASNIMWTIRSIMDSSQQILEWTAENTGKIGNALKRWRIVGENAYSWMPERVTSQTVWQQRLNRMVDGVQAAEDVASSVAGVTGDVISIQDEVTQLRAARDEFKNLVVSAEPVVRADNTVIKEAVDVGKAVSQSPPLGAVDLSKFEEVVNGSP